MNSVRRLFDVDGFHRHTKQAMDVWDFSLGQYQHVRGPSSSSVSWGHGIDGERHQSEYVTFSPSGLKPTGVQCGYAATATSAILSTLCHVLDYVNAHGHVRPESPEVIVWREFSLNNDIGEYGKARFTVYARLALLPPGAIILDASK